MKKKKQNGLMITLICMLVLFSLLAIDLFTKQYVQMLNIKQEEYFLGLVRIWFDYNDGIAYSLFGGNEVAMGIVKIFTAIMCVGIAVLIFTVFRHNTPAKVCLSVIEAGAIGNLLDRLFVSDGVRDFVDVSKFGFGICNIADFCITGGAVVLLFIILFIGEDALFPLKKEWREAAKEKDRLKQERKQAGKHDKG